jgi:hypothetical protein
MQNVHDVVITWLRIGNLTEILQLPEWRGVSNIVNLPCHKNKFVCNM